MSQNTINKIHPSKARFSGTLYLGLESAARKTDFVMRPTVEFDASFPFLYHAEESRPGSWCFMF